MYILGSVCSRLISADLGCPATSSPSIRLHVTAWHKRVWQQIHFSHRGPSQFSGVVVTLAGPCSFQVDFPVHISATEFLKSMFCPHFDFRYQLKYFTEVGVGKLRNDVRVSIVL
jgi:hypothetical protein